MKICTVCQISKHSKDFGRSPKTKDKLRYDCRQCQYEYNTEYRIINRERVANYHRKYQIIKRDKIQKQKRKYEQKNREKIRLWNRDYSKKRLREDIHWKLKRNLSGRIYKALKGLSKDRTVNLIGCSIEFLKSYLETKFREGMSWNNYGKWHIDHIIPCSNFDLSVYEQQQECFRYTNLQPLWASENLRKSDSLI